MDRSPGFGSTTINCGPIQTRFPFDFGSEILNLAYDCNSLARSTKSTWSFLIETLTVCKHKVSGSLSLPLRGSFHRSLTVLCTIDHWVVFSLGRWSSHLPTGFLVSCGTLRKPKSNEFQIQGCYFLWPDLPNRSSIHSIYSAFWAPSRSLAAT